MGGSGFSLREFAERELKAIAESAPGSLNHTMRPEFFRGDEEQMELVLKFPVLDCERNGLGMLHGGIMAAMADFTMSLGVQYFAHSAIPPTISCTINYIRPVPVGSEVLTACKITSAGRRVGTALCEVLIAGSGKRAAAAVGTYSVVPLEGAGGAKA